MFETAELGQKVSKSDYAARVPALREHLLEALGRLRKADFPVIVLFAGVDGAGKGETANLLTGWLDPRRIVTRAFGKSSEEEKERPAYWRYWRDLPPNGHIGLFLSAWYSQPLLNRVKGESSPGEFDDQLEKILSFERTLADDGALILKFWMHLGKKAQKRRFQTLEKDPLQAWRVTPKDWEHWREYDKFIGAAEHIIMRTSTGVAPWTIVEGGDERFRSLKVGDTLLEAIERRLDERPANGTNAFAAPPTAEQKDEDPDSGKDAPLLGPTILSNLVMTRKLTKQEYQHDLVKYQGRLNKLHRQALKKKVSTLLVFEGWDAAGKGGAIRRITSALDAREYQVLSIGAPTDEERVHHYLWRFWRHLSRAGRVLIFDRSWYGRVLVERVEGFATQSEWRRAYAEINDFEQQFLDHGIVLVKFWLHITKEEQAARFKSRQETPYKKWKLTDEDWRNREKWDEYETAVNDMIERTSTRISPWILVEGNDKRYARIKVLKALCDSMSKVLN